ncbi:MAG: hypothetical protein ACD_2C00002G0003 [uncultured bacterium (gcode 4)]|uniref:Uncharacterized protein n=1 Tax=uncultured bacterium (gcode 4) TaxID=1234023 RepID=K2H393_9BACT|nr:MAG: hypothetical protein ACD_2C00002G0003 [uncultured bacterium (gcode 4)]
MVHLIYSLTAVIICIVAYFFGGTLKNDAMMAGAMVAGGFLTILFIFYAGYCIFFKKEALPEPIIVPPINAKSQSGDIRRTGPRSIR